MREDLQLCAYAVALGFEPRGRYGGKLNPEAFEAHKGIPCDGVQFVSPDGRVSIWDTTSGWRAARLTAQGVYPRPKPEDFSRSLFAALNRGAELMKEKG
jgi:hypothetical protein